MSQCSMLYFKNSSYFQIICRLDFYDLSSNIFLNSSTTEKRKKRLVTRIVYLAKLSFKDKVFKQTNIEYVDHQ